MFEEIAIYQNFSKHILFRIKLYSCIKNKNVNPFQTIEQTIIHMANTYTKGEEILGIHYKEKDEIRNREKMAEEKLKINLKGGILDFGNYVYTQKTEVPQPKKEEKLKYLFPNRTSFGNKLIVSSDNN